MSVKLRHEVKAVYIILICLCLSCSDKSGNNDTLFVEVPDSKTGIDFENKLPLNDDLNVLNYIYYFNGGGVAAGDLNNDGLIDLFFTGNQVSNEMYINKGGFHFENSTADSGLESEGWSSGVSMVDINADGWIDIYVCRAGSPVPSERKNLLYINQKDGTFIEMATAYGLDDESYSTQAAFFDYDLDGDLDMYLLNHMHQMEGLNQPKRKNVNGEAGNTDKLFRNEGVGVKGHPVFSNVSKEVGITLEGFGLGVGISDVNQDGYPDIYVSNDFISNDILYINQAGQTFENRISEFIGHQSHNGMGNDLADINNDGLTDILVMDMLPSTNENRKKMLNKPSYDFFSYGLQMGYEPQYMRNTLQLNLGSENGKTHFGEIGQYSGISSTDWSWAGLFADYDLDGQKDLYVTNGYLKDMTDLDFINYRRRQSKFRTKEQADSLYLASVIKLPEVAQQNYFYKNNGDLTFAEVSAKWAPSSPGFSNGAVYADLDNDGDLDIVNNNINEKATVLMNTSRDNVSFGKKYLSLQFKGTDKNLKGIGTKVWAYTRLGVQFAENYTTRGFQSSVPPTVNFGFDESDSLDSLKVVWPDGKVQRISHLETNRLQVLRYTDAISKERGEATAGTKLFAKCNNPIAEHQELEYSDYRIEPLLPHKFSNDGPGIAVADINGDGLDDLFIGGSYTFPGQLFVQRPDGSLQKKAWNHAPEYEDLGALFFDADKDGDNDLYIVSGSNEFLNNKKNYQDRLYFNDGKGNFINRENALPEMLSSGSSVSAADFDRDGQLDLFVGGRVVGGQYGQSPKSYLLHNKGGTFEDVSKAILGEEFLGMVTSSLWTDYNNDGWIDLLVSGEWMPITIFKNNKGDLSEKIILENSDGWWNSINGGDFDNDGDIDYIAGNLGENSVFRASVEYPVELYLADFNKDGKIDPVITQFSLDPDGVKRSYPFVSRDLMADQMNFIKNKFKFYKDYAKAQINEFNEDINQGSMDTLSCKQLQSTYIENLGNGKFALHPLPPQAQLSPIFGTTIADYNLDGNLDVLLVGNFYHAEVGYGQYDASTGLLLKGDGEGNFTSSNFNQNGFLVDGDARSLVRLATKNGYMVLAAQNNDSLVSYIYSNENSKIIIPKSDQFSGVLAAPGGKPRKVEIYRGEGYLSQSTRTFSIPQNASIEWYNELNQ